MPVVKAKGKSKKSKEMTRFARGASSFAFCLFTFALLAPQARAHGGKPHNPRDLLTTWGLEPVVLVCLALSAWLYWRGLRRLWGGAEAGRGVRRREAWAYAGGWLALFVALVSPLHPLGRVLFSAHMTQHEVLMLVAAPLLVLGRPLIPFLWALPLTWARAAGAWARASRFQKTWRALTNPFSAWAIHAVALWVWHAPVLFQATIDNEWVHTAQHLSFLLSALLFWWAIIHGRRGWMGYGAGVLYMFTTSVHSGALGALITFSPNILYPIYERTTAMWGFSLGRFTVRK